MNGLNKILKERGQLLQNKKRCEERLTLHRQILRTSIHGSINKEEQMLNERQITNVSAKIADVILCLNCFFFFFFWGGGSIRRE